MRAVEALGGRVLAPLRAEPSFSPGSAAESRCDPFMPHLTGGAMEGPLRLLEDNGYVKSVGVQHQAPPATHAATARKRRS